jgi:hypothetical protein
MHSFTLAMLNGKAFLKHGRSGWPHKRLVWVDATGAELLLRWGKMENGLNPSGSSGVSLGLIKRIGVDRSTPTLQRSGSKKSEGKYFSILFANDEQDVAKESLDLECEFQSERDFFARNFARIAGDMGLLQGAMVHLYTSGIWVPPGMEAKRDHTVAV